MYVRRLSQVKPRRANTLLLNNPLLHLKPEIKELVIVNDKKLTKLGKEILEATGTTPKEAAWVSNCLVLSNLKGVDSHGVQQIPGYVESIQKGYLKPGAKPTLITKRSATAFYDGNWGYGYSIAYEVMKKTIKKAKKAGVAYSGIRNIHHIGRVGKWAEMALEENMIGIASQPGGIYIAPWGGIDKKLPIAPIAFAAPAGRYSPIVVDMSLGPIAGGRTAILALRGVKVPMGWYIDDEGKPHDDPKIFNSGKGAQLPLGQTGLGYKGMALSLMLSILAGPLFGHVISQRKGNRSMDLAPTDDFRRNGVFLGAIDIEAFTSLDTFNAGMESLIDDIKSSRLAEGFAEILMPGEPEWRELEKRSKEGIYLDDEIYQKILDTAKGLGVSTTKYRGKPGKIDITHPSYTLKDRYASV
jgi:LDH2 family malate/lactate/ureidoglycolate dehydrogenase